MRYHWIQKILDSKLLILEKIHINNNDFDMLINALFWKKLLFCKEVADLVVPPNELEREIVGLH